MLRMSLPNALTRGRQNAQAGGGRRQHHSPRNASQAFALLRDKLGVTLREDVLLLFDHSPHRDQLDVRSSIILDVLAGGEVVLAQTSPPTLKSMAGAALELSTVVRGDVGPQRLGLSARLEDVRMVRLSPEQEEIALLVRLEASPSPSQTNARAGVRVDLDGHSQVGFSTQALKMVALNLSVGGVGFHVPQGTVELGSRHDLQLSLRGRNVPVKIAVVRVRQSTFRHDYVGARFIVQGDQAPLWAKLRPILQAAIMAEQARQIRHQRGHE